MLSRDYCAFLGCNGTEGTAGTGCAGEVLNVPWLGRERKDTVRGGSVSQAGTCNTVCSVLSLRSTFTVQMNFGEVTWRRRIFPREPSPRIFVYTCERMPEPLIPLQATNTVRAKMTSRQHLCVLHTFSPLSSLKHHFYCLLRCRFPGDCPVAQ